MEMKVAEIFTNASGFSLIENVFQSTDRFNSLAISYSKTVIFVKSWSWLNCCYCLFALFDLDTCSDSVK